MDRPPGRGADRRVALDADPARRRRRRRRLRPRDIAVMYRTNAQSRAIEEAFLRYGIRYQLVGGTRFYQRREVKDALAYLRVLRSDTDVVSLRADHQRARPRRSATRRSRRCAPRGGARPGVLGGVSRPRPTAGPRASRRGRARPWPASSASSARLRARIGLLPLPELLDAVLERSGYRAMLADGSEEGEERWDEPARAALGHDPLRRPRARGRARPPARGDGARRRPGRVRGRGGRGDADHAPRRQGPRVPGRVHRRPRGRRLPAQPGARGRARARGGAPAGVRRDHPRQAAALPVARLAPGDLGDGPVPRSRRGSCWRSRPSSWSGRRWRSTTTTPRVRSTSTSSSVRAARPASARRCAAGGGACRQGSGRPGAPVPAEGATGTGFQPSRDLAARRGAYAEGARSGSLGRPRVPAWDAADDGDGEPRTTAGPPDRRSPGHARRPPATADRPGRATLPRR